MVTGSGDKTLCLWDWKDGVVLKKMVGHTAWVNEMVVSGDGRLIVSCDECGEFIAWDGDTGESLTKPKAIKAHSEGITSLDISPDGAVLATGSWDRTIKLWRTDTWKIHRNPIDVEEKIHRVRFSPSGKLLAVATQDNIQIWNPNTSEFIVKLTAQCLPLVWAPDGTRLLSGGFRDNHTIREWDTSTWKQVGDSWSGHNSDPSWIRALAINSAGTLLVSASDDKSVRLWRISDRRIIAVFSHSEVVYCVTFSPDGKYILCGGQDNNVTEWNLPEDAFLQDIRNAETSNVSFNHTTISPRSTKLRHRILRMIKGRTM